MEERNITITLEKAVEVIKFAMTVKALAEAKENGSVKTEEAPATEEAAA